jgi:hypothetical protein
MNYRFTGDAADGFSVSPLFFSLDREESYMEIIARIPDKCTFMWYLYDPSGSLRGQCFCQGSGKTVIIAQNERSYGTVDGILPEGKWTIWTIFFTPEEDKQQKFSWTLDVTDKAGPIERMVSDEMPGFVWLDSFGKVTGEYLQRSYLTKKAWYRGDFHVHTTLSDGKMTPSRVQKEAVWQALDFFAVTDHNFMHTCWVDNSMPVIPGMELTLEQGHFNLFLNGTSPFHQEEFWRNMTLGNVFTNTFLEKARESGAVISVNHPFMPPWEVKDMSLDLSMLDAMEIICDPTWHTSPEAAEMALQAFGILWNHGILITGIGGSDIHNPPEELYDGSDIPGEIGFPASWILADKLSVNDLLNALKEHRAFVAVGFRIDMTAKYHGIDYSVGSLLPIDDESDIIFTVSLLYTDQPYSIEIVENGITGRLGSCDTERTFSCIRNWDNGYHWLRFDIRNASGRLCGFTNPIYSGSRTKEKMSWGNLLELIA